VPCDGSGARNDDERRKLGSKFARVGRASTLQPLSLCRPSTLRCICRGLNGLMHLELSSSSTPTFPLAHLAPQFELQRRRRCNKDVIYIGAVSLISV